MDEHLDKLKDEFLKQACEWLEKCRSQNNKHQFDTFEYQRIDNSIRNAQVINWVSVKKELPKEEDSNKHWLVLVKTAYGERFVSSSVFKKGKFWRFSIWDAYCEQGITHWAKQNSLLWTRAG
jgi:hypothetical protein